MALPSEVDEGFDPELFARLAEVEDESFWFRARNRLLVQLVSEVAAPGARFLEVGCGTGYVLEALVRECGLSATGSDPFAAALAFARRRVPEASFIELDARTMPYEQCFDLAGAFDVLEHIDDDVAVLRGLRKAIRPGGFVVVTVPQHPALWSAADTYAHHVRRYRRHELADRVRESGLVPIRITSFVSSLLPLMAISRWRARRDPRAYDPIDDLVLPRPLNRVFEWILDGERRLIGRGVNLPFGGSLVLVARRDGDRSAAIPREAGLHVSAVEPRP
jgi:SAM-dependent methyltransferase